MQKQVVQGQTPDQHRQRHKLLEIDEISNSLSSPLLKFCNDELFPETMLVSEITSCSNCCLEDYNIDSADLSLPRSTEEFSNVLQDKRVALAGIPTTATTDAPIAILDNNNQSLIFYSSDDVENDISASIDFSPSPPFSVLPVICTRDEQFEFQLSDVVSNTSQSNCLDTVPLPPIVVGPHNFHSVYEDEHLSLVPSYMATNPSLHSRSLLSPGPRSYISTYTNPSLSADGLEIYTGSIPMNSHAQTLELDFQADGSSLFSPDSTQSFHAHDLQGFCGESQNNIMGKGGTTPLLSDTSKTEDPTFKVGKLSVEQRKEKIHRYMKKRNERNFSKKIKYACRKTLADSRPRVRGRFTKNGEKGQNTGNIDEEDKDGAEMVKGNDIIDTSDIFAHIRWGQIKSIPSGLHGMPRTTATRGPSNHIERWKSGGKCDCGGWDLGCPLTFLEARSTELAGGTRHTDLVIRDVFISRRDENRSSSGRGDFTSPKMSKRGRGGTAGNKFRMSLGLPVAATVNCADNTGAKNLYIISVKGIKGRLNRLPSACVGDMVMATVKKGKPDLRKKVMPAVIVRQRKPWRRKDGVFMYFEDNAGVIVNPKGEMKGSAITGPIGKECADLWPRIASAANAIV
ncbi:hypothetical protein MLD38_016989 [Melastoma candidum]|uniref:Uncharacterized protein n=4 Tax=Melastoma candidum TaxID=119954 RepID=A0ACB9QQG8_9MYRT|nr:hypothetical protein MLD38_016989 [Melastoma candidum]